MSVKANIHDCRMIDLPKVTDVVGSAIAINNTFLKDALIREGMNTVQLDFLSLAETNTDWRMSK